MPALSKVQQRLMGMAYAYKKGELDSKDASQEVKDLADSMTLKQLKKFAATKHDGLPERVPENIQAGQINGMGPIELPADGLLGSGDVPAGRGDAEEEYKKKKKKMANFEEFINGLNSQQVSEAKKYNAKDIINAWKDAYGEDIMNSDHADVPSDIDNDYRGKVTVKDLEEIFDGRYGEELPSDFLDALGESVVNETRFYAIFQGAKHEIEADSLWAAKQKAITDLKVKKKDVGLLAIVNADEHDDFSKGKKGQFQFESDQVDEIRMSSWGDLEYTEEDINKTHGWCGTLANEIGEDKAMFLTHQGIHELQKRHMGLTVWEALAILNSKAGRHAAEAFLGKEADASDTTSSLIWYFGSKRKVQQAAKEEAELQFPSK
jgi:hypothetical protein